MSAYIEVVYYNKKIMKLDSIERSYITKKHDEMRAYIESNVRLYLTKNNIIK